MILPSRKSVWPSILLWFSTFSLHVIQIASQYSFAFETGKVHRSIMLGGWFGTRLSWEVVFFAFTVIGLYTLTAMLCAAASEALRRRLNYAPTKCFVFVSGYFLLWFGALISVCAYLFPHSEAVGAYHHAVAAGGAALPAIMSALVILSLIPFFFQLLTVARESWQPIVVASGMMLLIVSSLTWTPSGTFPPAARSAAQPNLIILGIDSLRPDRMGHRTDESLTPFLDELLSEMVLFGDGITPLARTNPAWTSLLTGLYPIGHGAVVNLTHHESIDTQYSLAAVVHGAGYETVYATDEVRFSNIDGHYGFGITIGPRIGAGDFLIGSLSDIPLVILLTNTRPGRWLFPYLHGNRAVAQTYRPETFEQQLSDRLNRVRVPVMIAIHLCLPHWPYHWAESIPPRVQREDLYAESLRRTDLQAQRIMRHLQNRGWLDDAIVVVFSDHGESFETDADSILREHYLPDGRIVSVSGSLPPTGHGTSLEAPAQYEILIGIQHFRNGAPTLAPGTRSGRVTLMDLRPTLSELLALEERNLPDLDGISLAPILRSPSEAPPVPERYLFMETGFNTPAVMTGLIEIEDVFEEAHIYYDVDADNGRLFISPHLVGGVLQHKEFAVLRGDWQITALPRLDGSYRYRVIHRSAGRWAWYADKHHLGGPDFLPEMKKRLADRIEESWEAYRRIYRNPDLRPGKGSGL